MTDNQIKEPELIEPELIKPELIEPNPLHQTTTEQTDQSIESQSSNLPEIDQSTIPAEAKEAKSLKPAVRASRKKAAGADSQSAAADSETLSDLPAEQEKPKKTVRRKNAKQSAEQEQEAAKSESSAEAVQTKPKARRGRPPKTAQPKTEEPASAAAEKTEQESASYPDEQNSAGAVEQLGQEKPKAKRGRKRKTPEPADETQTEMRQPETASEVSDQALEEKPKAKRGRKPKKTAADPVENESESDQIQPAVQPDVLPEKQPDDSADRSVQEAALEEKPKTKRGRKPKAKTVLETAEPVLDPSEQKNMQANDDEASNSQPKLDSRQEQEKSTETNPVEEKPKARRGRKPKTKTEVLETKDDPASLTGSNEQQEQQSDKPEQKTSFNESPDASDEAGFGKESTSASRSTAAAENETEEIQKVSTEQKTPDAALNQNLETQQQSIHSDSSLQKKNSESNQPDRQHGKESLSPEAPASKTADDLKPSQASGKAGLDGEKILESRNTDQTEVQEERSKSGLDEKHSDAVNTKGLPQNNPHLSVQAAIDSAGHSAAQKDVQEESAVAKTGAGLQSRGQHTAGHGTSGERSMRTAVSEPSYERKPVHRTQESLHSEGRDSFQRQQPSYRRREAEHKEPQNMQKVEGVLEILQDGYGFLRGENYLSSRSDIFVSANRIKSMRLRTGDLVSGYLSNRIEENKARQLEQVTSVNGHPIIDSLRRRSFEKLTPCYPVEKLEMETTPDNMAGRMIDLLAPVGKGQRGLIISPPKAGKTTLLKSIAHSIQVNHPEVHLIILLIDERPEEVTDIKDTVLEGNVEVIYSTFDEEPEHHRRVAEMAIERAKAMVEMGDDVVILLDSITRLARTYNLLVPNSGKILSGGLDPVSLYYPKHFFGAARNIREGGSLTILATALVDTGSRMDEVIFEEFKGTGNMELILSRDLAFRRIFPAVDVLRSGTRKDDLLLSKDEASAAWLIRRHAQPLEERAAEDVMRSLKAATNNKALVAALANSRDAAEKKIQQEKSSF